MGGLSSFSADERQTQRLALTVLRIDPCPIAIRTPKESAS